jgi:hypothetical protein
MREVKRGVDIRDEIYKREGNVIEGVATRRKKSLIK